MVCWGLSPHFVLRPHAPTLCDNARKKKALQGTQASPRAACRERARLPVHGAVLLDPLGCPDFGRLVGLQLWHTMAGKGSARAGCRLTRAADGEGHGAHRFDEPLAFVDVHDASADVEPAKSELQPEGSVHRLFGAWSC